MKPMPPSDTRVTRRCFVEGVTATAVVATVGRLLLGLEPVADAPGQKLRAAMDRAVKCCLAWLNPEKEFLPTGGYEVAHDTGRWWDAMLRYEAATGESIPEWAETPMLNNLRTLSDNSAGLLASDDLCNPHNIRESMLAYTALVQHRQSDWAKAQGRKLIKTIHSQLQDDGQLDYAALATSVGKPLTQDQLMIQRAPAGGWFNATASTGRAIEAIVWFHEATGDDQAMELARRLAQVHLRQTIDASGKIRGELLDLEHVGHTHSYCGTLRGLLLFGLAANEKEYVDAVANTYHNGLWGSAISHSGWTPHDQGKIRFPDAAGDPIGEHGSCGDVIQLALWLGLRAGQPDLLNDVERLIRARLLPSQEVAPSDPRSDGAWGVYGHPFGRGATLDVFAAVLHSLADVYQNIVTTTPEGVVLVNLHIDKETPSIIVRSRRETDAQLDITLQQSEPLRIRIPAWVSRSSVRLSAGGDQLPLIWDGSFLVVVKGIATGKTITLRHNLPEQQTVEEMPISHRKFELSWRGDEVVSCDPQVPIYPPKQ